MITQEFYRIIITGLCFGFIPIFYILYKIYEAIRDNNKTATKIFYQGLRISCSLEAVNYSLSKLQSKIHHECNSIFAYDIESKIAKIVDSFQIEENPNK